MSLRRSDVLPCVVADGGSLPRRGTDLSAGLDVYATQDRWLWPLCPAKLSLGLSFELPPGSMARVEGRSSLADKGLAILGGVIDEDYRGGVAAQLVILRWFPLRIRRGDRIAQLVIQPIYRPQPVSVATLSATTRGAGGFGSTGR